MKAKLVGAFFFYLQQWLKSVELFEVKWIEGFMRFMLCIKWFSWAQIYLTLNPTEATGF